MALTISMAFLAAAPTWHAPCAGSCRAWGRPRARPRRPRPWPGRTRAAPGPCASQAPGALPRRALGHDGAAAVAAFGTEVDQPVAGTDHVQVVLDDDQRVPGLQQLAQRAHELGDVVEVQARGGLVVQEQCALLGQRLLRLGLGLGRLGQEARELEALGLAARQRGHGLAQLHVFKAHIDDGLQGADDLAVLGEQQGRLGHGELQHIGHVELARLQLAGRVALDRDFQDLGAVARAVAVGAAQVDVGEELHLHMLEARAAAGGATAVAAVEAELGGRVAALARQRRNGEQLADGVPGAHVAGRVGARRLADGRLVHEHHVAQVVGAQQALEGAGRIRGLAEVAHQRGHQHVLDQRGLARAADAGDGDQALQRKVHVDAAQVVLARAFEDEARRGLGHHALEAEAHLLAAAQVGAGQRVGMAQVVGRAVEDDLAAARAGAGAHVDHAVGREHHGRVVLDHDQGVACIAQALHGLGDAFHVARVQADAGLVEHEQGVDQRGAQGRGQIDALHLAARQRAALAVQREVADAHVAQVLHARHDFGVQHLEGLGLAVMQRGIGSRRQLLEEITQPHQGQLHQVVQAQARQRVQLLAAPGHALRHEAAVAAFVAGRQHGIGGLLAAQAPQQAFGLQPRAAAGGAFGIAAVLGQQHPDVHLVGLALQVFEEALDAVPGLGPLAIPVGRAVQHPALCASVSLAQAVSRGMPSASAWRIMSSWISFQAGVCTGLMAPVRRVSLSLGMTSPSPRRSRGQSPGRPRRRPRRS